MVKGLTSIGRCCRRLVILAVTTFLLACGDNPQLSPLYDGDRILAFGDSLTYGTGVERQYSYPSVLAELTGLEVINMGVPGEESTAGLLRLQQVLAEDNPQLVILCHGGNDFLRKRSRETLAENLIKMIEIIRTSGAQVVLLGVPRPGLFLSSENLYGEIAEQMQVPIELKIVSQLLSDNSMKSDPVHFNRQGYAAMANAVFELLVAQGAITETL